MTQCEMKNKGCGKCQLWDKEYVNWKRFGSCGLYCITRALC